MQNNPNIVKEDWYVTCAECGAKWEITSISPTSKVRALGVKLGDSLRKEGWYVNDEASLCPECIAK